MQRPPSYCKMPTVRTAYLTSDISGERETYAFAPLKPTPPRTGTRGILGHAAKAPQRDPAVMLTVVLLEGPLVRGQGNELGHDPVVVDLRIMRDGGLLGVRDAGAGVAHEPDKLALCILAESIAKLIEDSAAQQGRAADISGIFDLVGWRP